MTKPKESLHFRILGPLEVIAGGRAVPLGGTKQRAVLALLILHAREVVSVDSIVDRVWGESPPDKPENLVQVYVSRLRKTLDAEAGRSDVLVTRRPGYALQISDDEIDARAFERAAAGARTVLGRGDAGEAAGLLRRALGMFRGEPLADLAYEPFARAEADRLAELRLTVLEDALEAELAAGRGPELVAELEALVAAHPLRERLRAHLMLALYRAGRQAEALSAYQDARRTLTDELGIDPSPALQDLEREILRQAPRLSPGAASAPSATQAVTPSRSILVAPRSAASLPPLLALTEPLARTSPPFEVIIARLLGRWEDAPPDDLAVAARDLADRVERLIERGVAARAMTFTSDDPAGDLSRISGEHEVELLCFDVGNADLAGDAVAVVLEQAECDVAAVVGADRPIAPDAPVVAPFGGAAHDWAALNFAAWIARARGMRLQLLGSTADPGAGARDASRLLANASLVVQRMTGVVAEPVLSEPGEEMASAVSGAGLVVMGLSERWRDEGLGATRERVADQSPCPVIVVRRGPRSGAQEPRADQTVYAWSRARAVTAPMTAEQNDRPPRPAPYGES